MDKFSYRHSVIVRIPAGQDSPHSVLPANSLEIRKATFSQFCATWLQNDRI